MPNGNRSIAVAQIVNAQIWQRASPPKFVLFSSDMSAYGYTLLSELEVSYTPPEGFNPVVAEVAAIEAAKQKAMNDYQASVKKLNDRLAKLLAVTNEVQS